MTMGLKSCFALTIRTQQTRMKRRMATGWSLSTFADSIGRIQSDIHLGAVLNQGPFETEIRFCMLQERNPKRAMIWDSRHLGPERMC